MSNGNGSLDWKAVLAGAVKQAPAMALLAGVLWFVGTSMVDLGTELLIVQREQAAAIKMFATAVNRIADEDMARGMAEREEHKESMAINEQFLNLVKYVSEKRDIEIDLLKQVVREISDEK